MPFSCSKIYKDFLLPNIKVKFLFLSQKPFHNLVPFYLPDLISCHSLLHNLYPIRLVFLRPSPLTEEHYNFLLISIKPLLLGTQKVRSCDLLWPMNSKQKWHIPPLGGIMYESMNYSHLLPTLPQRPIILQVVLTLLYWIPKWSWVATETSCWCIMNKQNIYPIALSHWDLGEVVTVT